MIEQDRSGRKRMVEDVRGGGGSVANVQVLPVSNVASFQLWAVGARGRAEAARVPLPRGAARWCARVRSPALFCGVWEGCGMICRRTGRARGDATGGTPARPEGLPVGARRSPLSFVFCLLSFVFCPERG